jgi:hypothetical protein
MLCFLLTIIAQVILQHSLDSADQQCVGDKPDDSGDDKRNVHAVGDSHKEGDGGKDDAHDAQDEGAAGEAAAAAT